MNTLFYFGVVENALNRVFSTTLFYSQQIKQIKENILLLNSLISTLENNNAKRINKQVRRNRENFLTNEEELTFYKNALKTERLKAKIIHDKRTEFQSFLYDNSSRFLSRFIGEKKERAEKFFIVREQDKNAYNLLDDRYLLTKADEELKIKELYHRRVISKTEYRNATRRKIYSENLTERLNIWRTHKLNRTSHKKYMLSSKKSNMGKYEYSEEFKRLIKIKKYAHTLEQNTTQTIRAEIIKKIKAERRIKAESREEREQRGREAEREQNRAEGERFQKKQRLITFTKEAEERAEERARAEENRTRAEESREREATPETPLLKQAEREAEQSRFKATQKADLIAFKGTNEEADIFTLTEEKILYFALRIGQEAEAEIKADYLGE